MSGVFLEGGRAFCGSFCLLDPPVTFLLSLQRKACLYEKISSHLHSALACRCLSNLDSDFGVSSTVVRY